ncbi:hypothetical protein [Aeromonas caviae]|uniref:hypothetical protein n=2 Tax=Aeromonas caviae TaxID=648 RepID=UPI00187D1C47|nr:hypothetical protein [Aeromonas caviae]
MTKADLRLAVQRLISSSIVMLMSVISTHYDLSRISVGHYSCAFSSIPFKRWWVDSFKTLCANAPAQAELVGSFLTREIEVLAEKARKNNDKSGSVYKRFVERFEYLSLRVNQEFLDSTSYILHPELFFNIVSNNLVSLNEQEKRELMNKARRDSHFDDPLKKWW